MLHAAGSPLAQGASAVQHAVFTASSRGWIVVIEHDSAAGIVICESKRDKAVSESGGHGAEVGHLENKKTYGTAVSLQSSVPRRATRSHQPAAVVRQTSHQLPMALAPLRRLQSELAPDLRSQSHFSRADGVRLLAQRSHEPRHLLRHAP